MLSRIAESLYWLGRYTERAEATARILDVYSHALLEDRVGGEESACRRLRRGDGRGRAGRLVEVGTNVESLVGFFVDDPRFAGSVVRSLEAMWENARGAREAMSSEMWGSINATHSALDVRPRPVGVRAARVPRLGARPGRDRLGTRRRHDEPRRHVALHRARSFARARRPHRAPAVDPARRRVGDARVGSRRCAAARRTSRTCAPTAAASTARKALEFLLLDRLFPRSVFHALGAAETVLFDLDPSVRPPRRRAASRAASSAGRARISSSSGSPSSRRSLPEHLARLERACAQAHDVTAKRFFNGALAIRWSA